MMMAITKRFPYPQFSDKPFLNNTGAYSSYPLFQCQHVEGTVHLHSPFSYFPQITNTHHVAETRSRIDHRPSHLITVPINPGKGPASARPTIPTSTPPKTTMILCFTTREKALMTPIIQPRTTMQTHLPAQGEDQHPPAAKPTTPKWDH